MDDATLIRRVAVEVMGLDFVSNLYSGEPIFKDKEGFTTLGLTWEDAGRVVEKMREKRFVVTIMLKGKDVGVLIEDHDETVEYAKVIADTMPRAVMLAALKAVEVKQKPAGLVPVYPGPDLQPGDTVYLEDGREVEVYEVTMDSGVRTSLGYVCATKLYREAVEVKP